MSLCLALDQFKRSLTLIIKRGGGLTSIPLRYKENFSPGLWYKCCLLKRGHNLVGLLTERSDCDRGRGNEGFSVFDCF